MNNKPDHFCRLLLIARKTLLERFTPQEKKMLGIKTPVMTLTELIKLYDSKIKHKRK